MNKKISVIVPVYNKEKYLNNCLDSILSQTYDNIELLLVDDGSTDGSAAICDDYAKKDSRVRVIHKQNGGVSSARNLGIESAGGDHITFCDADDELLPTALSDMYDAAQKYSADITVGGIENISIDQKRNEKRITAPLERKLIILNDRDTSAFCNIWESNDMLSSCTKLFSREFLVRNGLRYNENLVVLEDLDFVAGCLLCANTVVSIDSVVYRYYHYIDTGANYLRRSRRDFADDVAYAYNRQKQVFEHYDIDLNENRWQRWRCLFGNFDGALDSLWHAETNGFREKLDKCKRIRDVLKKPEFRVYVGYKKNEFSKSEYFCMKHPSIINVFILRRVREKLGK